MIILRKEFQRIYSIYFNFEKKNPLREDEGKRFAVNIILFYFILQEKKTKGTK